MPDSTVAITDTQKTTVVDEKSRTADVVDTSEGGKVKKGGQGFGIQFREALIAVYSNLCTSPALLGIYVLILAISTAEILELKNGPLEQWQKFLESNTYEWALGVWIKNFQLWIIKIFIANKFFVISFTNFFVPYMYKPSNKNLKACFCLALISVFFIQATPLDIVILGHLWFLFTQLRNNEFKGTIAVIAAVVYILPYTGLLDYMAGNTPPSGTYRSATTPPTTSTTTRRA